MNKITSKQYIARYVFLKILFEEYKLFDFVPSESSMVKQFKTTNLTVRSAYSILQEYKILKPFKGKGYQVVNDAISFLWPLFAKIKDCEFKINFEKNEIDFFEKDKNNILITVWSNHTFVQKNSITTIFSTLFREKINIDIFFNLSINESFSCHDDIVTIQYNFINNNNKEILLLLECRLKTDNFSIFNKTRSLNI